MAGLLLASCSPVEHTDRTPLIDGTAASDDHSAGTKAMSHEVRSLSSYSETKPIAEGIKGGSGALLEGRLTARNGCPSIETGDGKVYQLVFPKGKASWDDGGETLLVGDGRYRLNELASFGGGFLSADQRERGNLTLDLVDCPNHGLFLVHL